MTLFYEEEMSAADGCEVVGLCGGPGGWAEGLRRLGVREVGVELDRFACSTRRLAGHATVEANILDVDPTAFASASGLIASPPCQALSNSGTKHGRQHLDGLAHAIRSGDWDYRPHRDPNVWLALEVGRWWELMCPEWIALEQVPQALPLFEAFAETFSGAGWATWTGILDAADYGVPQHRRRAVLLAHATYAMACPAPLDSAPVTMSDALGLRPGPFHVSTGRNWNREKGTSQVIDAAAGPAPTLTGKSLSQWHLDVDPMHPRSSPRSRQLTIQEALAIQSFPVDYPMAGTREDQGRQIGNAVPPELARAILDPIISVAKVHPS